MSDTPIGVLELSAHARRVLNRAGISFVEQLLVMSKDDLVALDYCGESTGREILKAVKFHQLETKVVSSHFDNMLRNDAAIAAMQAALTAHLLSMPMPTPQEATKIAGQCYVMADAMVAASLVAREGVASGAIESQRLQQERGP